MRHVLVEPSTKAQRGHASFLRSQGRGIALALLLAVLCLPPAAQAQSALAELIASLEASERFEPDRVAAVYRETVLTGAGIDRAVARLRAYSRGAALSPEGQAASHLAIAHLQWRDGAIEDAVTSSDLALESSPTPQALLLKARPARCRR